MVSVVYHDLDQNAPRVKWLGITFIDGVPTDVSDNEKIEKLRGNRFFSIDEDNVADNAIIDAQEPVAPAKRGWPAGRPRKPQI